MFTTLFPMQHIFVTSFVSMLQAFVSMLHRFHFENKRHYIRKISVESLFLLDTTLILI